MFTKPQVVLTGLSNYKSFPIRSGFEQIFQIDSSVKTIHDVNVPWEFKNQAESLA